MRFCCSISFFSVYLAISALILVQENESTKLHRHRKHWADDGGQEHYVDEEDSSNEALARDDPDDGEDYQGHANGDDPHSVHSPNGENGHEPEPVPTTPSPCQFDELVKCLSDPMDDWAITLYSLKENIVAISTVECLGVREKIRNCIEDRAKELECDQPTILAVAARITDLLVHKKDSGNWLRSYYVTHFVCTEKGREIRDSIEEACLKQEHMGQMIFNAIRHMDEKLTNNHTASNRERCTFLSERALFLRSIAEQKCANYHPSQAALLMCETVKSTFLTMHREMFDNGDHKCQFTCEQATEAPGEEPKPHDETGGIGQPDANQGEHESRPQNGEAAEEDGCAGLGYQAHLMASALAVLTILQRTLFNG